MKLKSGWQSLSLSITSILGVSRPELEPLPIEENDDIPGLESHSRFIQDFS